MEKITFELRSHLKFELDLVRFPKLQSTKKIIQRGIDLLNNHSPRIMDYLSKQNILSRLKDFAIVIETRKKTSPKRVRLVFKLWIQKEKFKRLVFVVIEGIVLPFTGLLALLPGPNVFFYIPALLFYYHLVSYLGLRKVDVDELNLEIHQGAAGGVPDRS